MVVGGLDKSCPAIDSLADAWASIPGLPLRPGGNWTFHVAYLDHCETPPSPTVSAERRILNRASQNPGDLVRKPFRFNGFLR